MRLFVRQGFTETDGQAREIVQGVLDLLSDWPDAEITTGCRTQDGTTFRQTFEAENGVLFSPSAFHRHRLRLLRQSDAMVVIRTSLSESTAFEVVHNVGCGPGLPMLFAVHSSAPIRTTLVQDLDECVPATYAAFDQPAQLEAAVGHFLASVRAGASAIERQRNLTVFIHGLDVSQQEYACALAQVGPALAKMSVNGALPVQAGTGVF